MRHIKKQVSIVHTQRKKQIETLPGETWMLDLLDIDFLNQPFKYVQRT